MAAGLARGPGAGARIHPPQPSLTFPSCASPPGCGKQQTRPPCPQRSGSFHGARDPGAALCPKALWLSQCSDGATCIGSAESPAPPPRPPPDCGAEPAPPTAKAPGTPQDLQLAGSRPVCWFLAQSSPPRQRHHRRTLQWPVEGDKGSRDSEAGWCQGQWPLRAGEGTPPAQATSAGAGGPGSGRPCAPYPAPAGITLPGRRQPGPSAPRLPAASAPGDGRVFGRWSLHSWEASTSHRT